MNKEHTNNIYILLELRNIILWNREPHDESMAQVKISISWTVGFYADIFQKPLIQETPGRFPNKNTTKLSYILTMFNQHRDFPEIQIQRPCCLPSLSCLRGSTQNIRKNYCCHYFPLLHSAVSSKSALSLSLCLSVCLSLSLSLSFCHHSRQVVFLFIWRLVASYVNLLIHVQLHFIG